jgi:hypothetical protein
MAVARLGYVHITYAGIAQEGLPAVKRKLEHYLDRLLGVLRTVAARQEALDPPTDLSSTAAAARALARQEQAITVTLKEEVAGAANAQQLAAAFRGWLQRDGQLAVRANTLARRLGLPDCVAGARGAPGSPGGRFPETD